MEDETFNWETCVYRDKLGRQIESDELEILLRDKEYKIVAQDTLDKYLISTVWLGVPFGMGTEYFETVIWDTEAKQGERMVECVRYLNVVEAEKGHKEVVQEWKNTTIQDASQPTSHKTQCPPGTQCNSV